MPAFSIITVTKDNVAGLQRTYKSLQKQTASDFEWIVIDGESNDGSIAFLKTKNANWISEPDHGIYDAMNKGIKHANGDYVIFLNAGDRLANEHTIATLLHTIIGLSKKPFDFVYGDALETHKAQNQYKTAKDISTLKWGMFTHHQSMIYNRATIDTQRYSLKYKIASDYDFTARFLRFCKTIHYEPIPICIFEPNGISQQNAKLGRNEQFIIRKKLNIASALENHVIRVLQWGVWTMRLISPNLYWRVKLSGNIVPASSQI